MVFNIKTNVKYAVKTKKIKNMHKVHQDKLKFLSFKSRPH